MERKAKAHHRTRAVEDDVTHRITETLALAWGSPFYRRRWRRRPGVAGQTELSSLPLTDLAEWRRAVRRDPESVVSDLPALWTRSRHQGHDVWFPVSHRDLPAVAVNAASGLRRAGVRDGDRILAVLPPAPSVWNSLPYLILESDLSVEFFPLSIDTLAYKPSLAAFPIARQPDVFLASRALAADLARLAGPLPAWPRTVFFGDGGHGERLMTLPGYPAPVGRCEAGAWHLPEDAGLAEIQPVDITAGAQPGLRRVSDAHDGECGVLVLTTFTRAAPLVRMATGIRVRAAGPAPCPCGDPAPRFLTDDPTSLA
jgi:phenylacetate-coenzyme A ligase PaaK-like adenylate-forming protein